YSFLPPYMLVLCLHKKSFFFLSHRYPYGDSLISEFAVPMASYFLSPNTSSSSSSSSRSRFTFTSSSERLCTATPTPFSEVRIWAKTFGCPVLMLRYSPQPNSGHSFRKLIALSIQLSRES